MNRFSYMIMLVLISMVSSIGIFAQEIESKVPNEHDGYYEIKNRGHLKWFAEQVNAGNVKLNARLASDLVMSRYATSEGAVQIGTKENRYAGEFDGNGCAIMIEFASETENTALFAYINGAKIHDLGVGGVITTSQPYVSGVVGEAIGAFEIKNVSSSVQITTTANPAYAAGIVANCSDANKAIYKISDCLFAGSITGNNSEYVAGIIANVTGKDLSGSVLNCLSTAEFNSCSATNSNSLANNASLVKYSNCYYVNTPGGKQGDVVSLSDISRCKSVAFYLNGAKNEGPWGVDIDEEKGTANIVFDGSEPDLSELSPDAFGVYNIASADDLLKFAAMVNTGSLNIKAKLTEDIDVSAYQTMIGGYYNQYTGEFDGNGHSITIGYENTARLGGLFGAVGSGFYVHDLTVKGSIQTAQDYCGSIIGYCNGNAKLERCISEVNITTNKNYSGGLIAYVVSDKRAVIKECAYTGTFTRTAKSLITGGFVGNANNAVITISNSYVAAKYEGGSSSSHSGSFTGRFNRGVTVVDSYYLNSPGDANLGEQKTAKEFGDGTVCKLLNFGKTEETAQWFQTVGTDTYPVLNKEHDKQIEAVVTLTQDAEGYYLIENAGQLNLFSKLVNSGQTTINARVTADFEFSNGAEYYQSMIGTSATPYNGIFDGAGHTITLGYDTKSAYSALFSFVSGATIKDLNLKGTINTNTVYCASFIGQNLEAPATLERCVSSVNITSSYNGEMNTAGLIACASVNGISVSNCAFVGSIVNDYTPAKEQPKSTGAAGLIGNGSGKIVNIINSYASPSNISVAGSTNAAISHVGASLARYTHADSKIINSYYCSDFSYPTVQGSRLTATDVQDGTLCSLLNAGIDSGKEVWGQASTDLYPVISSDKDHHTSALTFNAEGNYYEIANAKDLLMFSAMVNNGKTSINAKVTGDSFQYGNVEVYYQSMIGYQDCPYEGVFDGGGKTITIGLNSYWNNTALFSWVSGATIKNLNLDGTITSTRALSASYVGRNVTNPVTLEKCISNVAINTTAGDEIHVGGLMACSKANLYHITNCAFTGSITATQSTAKSAAGFVGAGDSKRGFFTNCYSVATYSIAGASNCFAFCRNQGTNTVYTNCYYLNPLGTAQGSAKTLEEFNNGTVCKLLNSTVQEGETGAWYQNLEGAEVDAYPVLDNTHAQPASLEVPKDEYGRYLISTADHLLKFAGMVNQGLTNITGVLQRDIDFTSNQEMIGCEQHPFDGVFDGKYYTIKVNYNTVGKYLSLFGYVADATIKNLIVEGTVKSNSQYASGLVAANVNKPVTLESCMSSVDIESTYDKDETRIGGLIGYAIVNNYKITNCAFVGSIKGKNKCAGMVGTTGPVGYYTNCYVFPKKFEMSVSYSDCGVFSITQNQASYFRNCYYGSNLNASMIKQGNAMTAAMFKDGTVLEALNGYGLAEVVWYQNAGDDYPVLIKSHGAITPSTPAFRNDRNYVFLISTPEELRVFASIVNMGVTRISGRLENDIDYTYSEMIGTTDAPFNGVFDGQSHKITLHFKTVQKYTALFSCVGGATIKDLVVDGTLESSGQYLAGLIGYNKENTEPVTVSNCMSYAKLTSTYANEKVTATYMGGLAGLMRVNDYNFTNCAFVGKMYGGATSDYAAGLVSNGYGVKGTFSNCYAYIDDYTLGTTTNCATLCANPSATTAFNNCYYRAKIGKEQGSQMSDDKFLDGSVCYLLNNCPKDESEPVTWYQKVKTTPEQVDSDKYPVLDPSRGKFFPQDDMETDENGVYLIRTPMQLLRFASLVNDGQTSIDGKLMEDIVFGETSGEGTSFYQAMIGNATYPYQGTFDGNGKKVTIGYDTQLSFTALFSYVDGATISNLTIDGTVTTTKTYPAAFVGYVVNNPLTMDRCISKVDIIVNRDKGDLNAGGLIGYANVSFCKLTNCAFVGSITDTNPLAACVGGLVGNAGGKTINYNSCYVYADFNVTNPAASATFVRNAGKSSVSSSLFYLNGFGDFLETGTDQKGAEEFANGTVCFLLNGSSAEAEDVVWYQNAKTDTRTEGYDPYPVLDPSHEVVNKSTLTPVGDVYEIATLKQLEEFANKVNAGQTNINGKLTADIDLGSSNMMIGTEANSYVGTFDGQYHTITVHYNSNNNYVGLFSHVKTATIKNLITKGDITTGGTYCGGIVARNFYDIIDKENEIYAATPITMENCMSYVNITTTYKGGAETQAGGLIGLINWVNKGFRLTNCAFLGSITYPAEGKVCGGLVGRANTNGYFTNCYVDATFNVPNTEGSGTIVATSGGTTEFSNCYSSVVLGVAQVSPLTKEEFQNGTAKYLLNGCTDTDPVNGWHQGANDNDPVFVPDGDPKECPVKLTRADDGVYELSSAREVVLFAAMVNGGNTNVNARVMNDIVLKDETGNFYQAMIGSATHPYEGTFDGQHYAITVGYNTTSHYTGLFRYVSGATIKNLYLDGTITTNKQFAGSFVGYVKADASFNLENCISKVNITSSFYSITENVHNAEPLYCGGLIGCVASSSNKYYVTNCAFVGSIKEAANSKAEKSQKIAGFVGYGNGRTGAFKSCYTYLPAEALKVDIPESSFTLCYGAGQASSYVDCFFLTEFGTAQGDQMSQEEFENGTVCFLLNGSSTENVVWYQNTAANITGGQTVDPYPVLDKHNIVASAGLTKDAEGYYLISSAKDLVTFASMVNNGKTDINARVTADINFKNASGRYYQTMIGNIDNMYKGVFDGQFHKITLGYNTTVSYTGLFSVVSGATIKNLIVDGNVATTKPYAGSIVGRNYGAPMTLMNCMSYANVSSSYTNVSKEGVHADVLYLGGLVGRVDYSGGTPYIIQNCAFAGSIKATGVASDGKNEGKFVGGLVGYGQGRTCRFSNCYVYLPDANLSIDLEFTENSATLCYNSGSSTFANCYYLSNLGTTQGAKMSAELFADGFVCYLLDEGKTENVAWHQNTSSEPKDKLPVLTGDVVPTSTEWTMTKEGDYYLIGSTYNLVQFASMVNSGQTSINGKLTADIDFRNQSSVMIGNSQAYSYKGTFDGNLKTIKIDIKSSGTYAGLFQWTCGPTIKNLILEGAVTAKGKYVGGFVGVNRNGAITFENCMSIVDVSTTATGEVRCGGFAGASDRALTFTNCAYVGSISVPDEATFVGGFVGNNNTSGNVVTNCYAYMTNNKVNTAEGNATFIRTAGKAQYTNSYYLNALGSVPTSGVIQMEASQFADGSVCGFLNQGLDPAVWRQKLDGVSPDKYPVLYADRETLENKLTLNAEGQYELGTAEDLLFFMRMVNSGTKNVKVVLTADIDFKNESGYYQDMLGSSEYPFIGEFDGNGHTITVGYASTEPYAALFSRVGSCSIKNLVVKGNIETSSSNASGLVGYNMEGIINIDHCISDVDIQSTYDGASNNAGLVSAVTGTGYTISNSAFTGSMSGESATRCSGLVGTFGNLAGTVENCYVNADINVKTGGYSVGGDAQLTKMLNCYVNDAVETNNTDVVVLESADFRTGKATYLLNAQSTENVVWYQKLGTDLNPTITPTGSNVVYFSKNFCPYRDHTTTGYANAELLGHEWHTEYDEGILKLSCAHTDSPLAQATIVVPVAISDGTAHKARVEYNDGWSDIELSNLELTYYRYVYASADPQDETKELVQTENFVTDGDVYARFEFEGKVYEVVYTIASALCFEGGSSNKWNVSNNWKKYDNYFGTPTDKHYALIPSGKTVVISEVANALSVIVESGATLIVGNDENPNATITIAETLQNKGTIIFKRSGTMQVKNIENQGKMQLYYGYGADSPSLIYRGSFTGEGAEFYRRLRGGSLFYTGSSTKEGTVTSSVSETMYEGINNSNGVIGYYPKNGKEWSDNIAAGFTKFNDNTTAYVLGYRGGSDKGFVQVGTPSVSAENRMSITSGWRWFCNPYPYTVSLTDYFETYNANKDGGFLMTGAAGQVSPKIWVRTNNGGTGYGYMTYDVKEKIGANGETIAPFQAICFAVYEDVPNFALPSKPITTTHTALKSSCLVNDLLRLKVYSDDNEKADDEVVMAFRTSGAMTVDVKNRDTNIRGSYSNLSQLRLSKPGFKDQLAIAIYPLVQSVFGKELPLSVVPKSSVSKIRISASNISWFDETADVFLVDHLTDKVVNLRKEDYVVTDMTGATGNRFAVVLKDASEENDPESDPGSVATDIDEPVVDAQHYLVFSDNGSIYIDLISESSSADIVVYDILGRVVSSQKATDSPRTVIPALERGVYIVKIGTETHKVLVE